VLVVHDDQGLTDHFVDLVGRFAGAGYGALCVDLRRGRDLATAPVDVLLADLRAGLDELRVRFPGRKLGAVGFGFGGGLVWSLLSAGEPRLAAAVPFYGEAPEEPDFTRCRAAVLAIYGQYDEPVNSTQDKADYKLFKANRERAAIVYPGTRHAFFDDTGPGYDAGAAAAAWRDTGGWLDRHL
jgi:carboxymethylenebutenolidase